MKHFISLSDVTPEEFNSLLDLADQLKREQKAGRQKPLLAGRTLGMIFSKSSTRTRVSFEVGMFQLGGHALFLSANDIQIGRGESIAERRANVEPDPPTKPQAPIPNQPAEREDLLKAADNPATA